MASSLGITFQQIQKYEKGTNRIGASRLQHIARVLTVPVSFFFEDAPGGAGEPGAGIAEAPSASYVVDFLSSSEGLQLNKAFVRIKDAKLRRKIVDLVRALAGDDDEEPEPLRSDMSFQLRVAVPATARRPLDAASALDRRCRRRH